MRYKSRVQQLLDNLDNQLNNLKKALQNSEVSGRDTLDVVSSACKTTETALGLVRLEDDDFSQTSNAPAPGSQNAPTPRRGKKKSNKNYGTSRVEEGDFEKTRRVRTEGGKNRNKRTTKRVEFDD